MVKRSLKRRMPILLVLILMLACARVVVRAQGPPPKAADALAGNVENGKRSYEKYGCYECHGHVGQGSAAGPRIAPHPIRASSLVEYCRHPNGEMPPYTAKVISDSDLLDIYAFLQSQPEPPAAKNLPQLN